MKRFALAIAFILGLASVGVARADFTDAGTPPSYTVCCANTSSGQDPPTSCLFCAWTDPDPNPYVY